METIANKDINFLIERIRRKAGRMKIIEKGLTFRLILAVANWKPKLLE